MPIARGCRKVDARFFTTTINYKTFIDAVSAACLAKIIRRVFFFWVRVTDHLDTHHKQSTYNRVNCTYAPVQIWGDTVCITRSIRFHNGVKFVFIIIVKIGICVDSGLGLMYVFPATRAWVLIYAIFGFYLCLPKEVIKMPITSDEVYEKLNEIFCRISNLWHSDIDTRFTKRHSKLNANIFRSYCSRV